MTEAGKKSYQCPKCGQLETLWEAVTVPGWRSINKHLEPEGDREVVWSDAEFDGWASAEVGCVACSWEGSRIELVAVGIDGNPLPIIHPSQMNLEESP